MRLDKYLKLTRLIKRRSVANELSSRGIFLVNGKVAKPSTTIKVGDVIDLTLGRHKLKVRVKEILEFVKKEQASSLYDILEDTIVNEIEFGQE